MENKNIVITGVAAAILLYIFWEWKNKKNVAPKDLNTTSSVTTPTPVPTPVPVPTPTPVPTPVPVPTPTPVPTPVPVPVIIEVQNNSNRWSSNINYTCRTHSKPYSPAAYNGK